MKTRELRIALIATAVCLPPQAAQAQGHDLTLSERWRTKGNPHVLEFTSVDGVVETAAGAIWISDALSKAVVGVDAQGRNMRWIARPGDGPGEVRSPTWAARVPSGGVAVYDQDRQSVDLLRDDGRFVRRVLLSTAVVNPKGFAVLDNGEILISGGLQGGARGGAVHRFGSNGRLIGSWGMPARARNPRAVELLSGGPIAALPGRQVLFSQAAPHRIELVAATGWPSRLIAAQPTLVPAVGDNFIQERAGRRVFRWHFPQSAGVFRLASGDILNVIWNPEAETSTWEVYRPTGALVVRKRFARAYRPWALTRNGDILATVVDTETGEVVVVRLALRVT